MFLVDIQAVTPSHPKVTSDSVTMWQHLKDMAQYRITLDRTHVLGKMLESATLTYIKKKYDVYFVQRSFPVTVSCSNTTSVNRLQ